MTETPYTPPVDQLLTIGEPEPVRAEKWPDYLALGIGPDDIPELIRLATDREIHDIHVEEYDEDDPTFYAAVHAIRALGQLHSEAAIYPLLSLFDESGDEWIVEELAEVYGMIGPQAIPALASYLQDTSHEIYSRAYASNGLIDIAEKHPESRSDAIAPITQVVGQFEENDPELTAFLIGDLAHVKATETLPLIERAFEAERVDEFIIDLDFVLEEFGLKERKPYEPPDFAKFFTKIPHSENIPAYEDAIESVPTPAYTEPPSFPMRDSYAQSLAAPIKFSGNKKQGKKKKQKSHKKR